MALQEGTEASVGWCFFSCSRGTSRSLSALWPKLCPECLPSVCLDVSAADFCSGLILTMDKWRLTFEEYCHRKVMETAEMLKKKKVWMPA